MFEESTHFSPRKASTGVPGLDLVLSGGLAHGGLFLIEGAAGIGKTLLANQMAFAQARQGENVIYLTLLVESHGKLLHHLRDFDFYEPTQVTHRIFYISGYKELLDDGLNGLLELLASLIAKYTPTLLVIDGFRSARDFFATELELAKFVHELNAFVTAAGCTTVLLSPPDSTHSQPEQILVDGLIEMTHIHQGLQTLRVLEVHKIRGAPFLAGKHFFRIGEKGIELYPRLESTIDARIGPPPVGAERKSFGMAILDQRLGGGLKVRSINRLLGSTRCGKSLLGLKFLEQGARDGEAGLYWSLRETRPQLEALALGVGLEVDSLVDQGRLFIEWHPLGEITADELCFNLFEMIKIRSIRRLVLDDRLGFEQALIRPERSLAFWGAFMRKLQVAGVTTLVIECLNAGLLEVDFSGSLAGTSVDQILFIDYEARSQRRERTVSVFRSGELESTGDELLISEQGLDLKLKDRRHDLRDLRLSSRLPGGLMQSSVNRVRDSALRALRRF